VNKQVWYGRLTYVLSMVAYAPIACAALREAPLKISNRTGKSWIWVRINEKAPIKIWRSEHIQIALPQTARIQVYTYDPERTNRYQEYEVSFDDQGLNKIKYGLEVRTSSLIYRFVGTDTMKQHKIKRAIKPIKKELT
jgi:hypothetical protein